MVQVGQVVGAFGIEGAVKVRPLTDFPERFESGAELLLSGTARRVEWSRHQSTGLVLKLSGLDSRTLAEQARGQYLEVADEELRPLPEGRWYHHQLVGLAVTTPRGTDLGRLTAVLERPANDVWVARRGDAEYLIPAIRDAVLDVDLEAGRVTVADWLLEAEEA